MKKRVELILAVSLAVLLITFLLIFSVNVLADEITNNEATDSGTDKVAKGYSCLKEKVGGNCDSLSVEEQAFSLLALAYDSSIQGECKSSLLDKSSNEECWPSGSCRLRDTALAILALDNIGADTDKAKDWILSQKKTPTELIWYLEIDADEETTCKISYDSTEKTIK